MYPRMLSEQEVSVFACECAYDTVIVVCVEGSHSHVATLFVHVIYETSLKRFSSPFVLVTNVCYEDLSVVGKLITVAISKVVKTNVVI